MQALKDALLSCGALMYGDFTLASGKKSGYYIDIKKATTDPSVLSVIADGMLTVLTKRNIKYDKIAGVVLGSVPLAVALSLKTGIPFLMIRREKKDHGTGKMIEGSIESGDRVIVIEDVVTSARSAAEAVTLLRESGAIVDFVVAVVDREEGGRDYLKSMNIELISLLSSNDLLGKPHAF
ncbi:MAG: orotate phosphoribosyltransferase [Methanomassiliicoccales archaeon]|nr:orotate phosphoribosyltransferase [Methanomassiliicoccales archaeon]